MSVLLMFKNAYKTLFLKDKIGDVTEWQHTNGLAFLDFQATAIKRNNVTTLILTSSWFSAERAKDARLWDKMSDSECEAFPLILCVSIIYLLCN